MVRDIFKRAFIHQENKSLLEKEDSNYIVYEIERDFIILHSVVGELDTIIAMAEKLSKRLNLPIAFQGQNRVGKGLEK